ncbi:mitochondrial ubiquitin ligase activator of NFKB 1-like [Ornithodoros turicata]|uniref:RING-type E3 ubiquitin transferase n=1 Tax=Ornithodoros turicata TaxID=34597 RepID=A0A2R5LL74_9ACAR
MPFESFNQYITVDNVCLGINVVTLSVLYKIYRSKVKNCEAVQTARHFEIDKHLAQRLTEDYPNGTAVHAIIKGEVKAIGKSLKSRHVPGTSAVVQQCCLTEHKLQWSPLSRFWSHTQREIQRIVNAVPFALCTKHKSGDVAVEVVDPTDCEELPLKCVYDHFIPNSEGLGGAFFSWLRGEQTKGLQEEEFLLEEGTVLSGFGTLVSDGTSTKLVPPEDGVSYHITTLSHSALLSKLKSELAIIRIGCLIFGGTAAFLTFYILFTWWRARQARVQEEKDAIRKEEVRKERRKLNRETQSNHPACVVCLSHPVEVMLLECGHVCLCADCAEQALPSCPVCRAPIVRSVAAFLP